MKSKSFLTLLLSFATMCCMSTAVAVGVTQLCDVSPLVPFAITAVAMTGLGFLPIQSGIMLAGLNRETWLAMLMKKFRPDPAWLSECRDLSAYVLNDVINLADAGVDPEVIIGYDGTYPIPITGSTEDTPLSLPLTLVNTKKDVVRKALQDTRAYDIMSDRTDRHARSLEQAILILSAYGISPQSDGALHRVLAGTTAANGAGQKLPSLNDFIDLRATFSNANINAGDGKLVLVLHPIHQAALQKEDKVLFKKFLEQDPYLPFELFGFKCYVSTATPLYNNSNGTRKAYGAVAAGTDAISSFAFLSGEAGRAEGTLDMFLRPNDPDYMGDIFNFSKRFFGGTIRNKGIAAIYTGV